MKKIFYIYLLLYFVFYIGKSNPVDANLSGLSGYVVDSKTKETLIGVSVYVKDVRKGAYTNKLGFFSIMNIKPGKYIVEISSIGYDKKKDTIEFPKGHSVRQDFQLTSSLVMTDEVVVEVERENEKREISISKVNIPVQQLKEIRIGGEADVFRSLQYLPGVLTSSQISSGLYIRGGSPDQNLVLVDGSTVYNPTHMFGFISTFNTNAVKDVELIKGGFPAEYGGRLSSVLNITQNNGNYEEFEGMATLGVISSQLLLEGPLAEGSFFIAGRRTYLELIKAFYPEDPESPLPDFNFYDINAKITQDIGKDDKLFLSGFMSADAISYKGFGTTMNLDIGNKLISMKWTHIFDDNLFSSFNLSTSNYVNNFNGDQSGYVFIINNSISDVTAKGSIEWFATDKLTAKFGFESNYYTYNYLQDFTGDTSSTVADTFDVSTDMTVYQWTHSLFGQLNYNFNEVLSAQMGLRTSYWELSNTTLIHPRMAFRYQVNEDVSLKIAWGLYDQNLRLATQPDFTFFDTWLPTDKTVAASTSEHYILTLETSPFEGYKLDFDVYYKKMNNINELNKTALKGEVVSDIFFVGDGVSYGAELFIQKSYGKLTGWIGYTLGYIYSKFDELNYGKEFRPKYDRRHDLKIVTQYKINDSWDVGAIFTFQSGQSYTGATSRFQTRLPEQNYGRAKIINSQLYGLRLPPSHQLNVNCSFKFKTLGKESRLIVDIYNVYSRRDIWFRYYNTREEVTTVEDVLLLPIIPSISYELNF
ncbi:MAG: TonB-dependent receptor [bacterium]